MTENIVIIGAAGGVGRALVEILRARGASVLGTSRTADRAQKLGDETGIETAVGDARSLDEVRGFFEKAAARGPITGAVNLAGTILLKPAHLTSVDEWRETIETNLTTSFYVVREASLQMRAHGGSVVLVSSVAARFGLANHEAIAAAKAGVAGLALSAAASYAPQGLRFNVVAPALVRTPLTERLTQNEAQSKASMAMHPLRRLGEPNDVASAIAWLLDPAQSWVTGQHFGVDGGMGSLRPQGGAR